MLKTINYTGGAHIEAPPFFPYNDPVGFMSVVEKQTPHIINSNLRSELLHFKLYSNKSGGLLIKNLPLGTIGITPDKPSHETNQHSKTELLLLTIAKFFGEPVGYAPEHGGTIVQNILPVKTNSTTQQSTSSNVLLAFHTEQAFHPHRPRFLFLLCLKGDVNAHTLLCSIDDIVPYLSNNEIQILKQKRFVTKPDKSFLPPGVDGEYSKPLSVFNHNLSTMVFDEDLMVGVDVEANSALECLKQVINDRYQSVCLQSGDLLIVDNNRAVHGRTPFKAKYDGTDRWLQRAFVLEDLINSSHERNGRIITTQFA